MDLSEALVDDVADLAPPVPTIPPAGPDRLGSQNVGAVARAQAIERAAGL